MTALKLPERLQNHRGFARTFQPGKLTLGLIAPFKGYPDSPVPEMDDFATVLKAADHSGSRCSASEEGWDVVASFAFGGSLASGAPAGSQAPVVPTAPVVSV